MYEMKCRVTIYPNIYTIYISPSAGREECDVD